jgi:transposase InsO family protein
VGAHHDPALATAALQVAVAIRGGDVAGVIFHTDQGGEYTGRVFATACRRAKVCQSMGRTGSALDNAVAESFNSTLEFELLADTRFTTRVQAHPVPAQRGPVQLALPFTLGGRRRGRGPAMPDAAAVRKAWTAENPGRNHVKRE